MSAATVRSPDSLSMRTLSVVLLGASEVRRKSLVAALAGTRASVLRDAPLPDLDALPALLEDECDVLIVDLDRDMEHALELVEAAVGLHPAITVMVHSPHADRELLMRCMQAGARELLSEPLSADTLTEALVRASVRRDEVKKQKKTGGKLLVFVGAKGGSGVTTIATNFAVALAMDTHQSVALLDLDLQLGDAALNLGLANRFSTLDAFQNEQRLDSELLSRLMVRHSSGVHVLGAPNEHNMFQPATGDVASLLELLRQDFAWVVVDAGSHYNDYTQSLFDAAEKVYLVAQVNVTELRNCHRLIGRLFTGEAGQKLEVIINRFVARVDEIGEQTLNNVLMDHPRWKVPSDFESVRRAQNSATAIVVKDGSITRAIRDIARAASGKKIESKKRMFGLF